MDVAKVNALREALGGTVDEGVAQEILEANDWNVDVAVGRFFNEGGGGGSNGPGTPHVRSPMRTGYTDTLIGQPETGMMKAQRKEAERQLQRQKEEEAALEKERRRVAKVEQTVREQRARLEEDALRRRREQQKQRQNQQLADPTPAPTVPKVTSPGCGHWMQQPQEAKPPEPLGANLPKPVPTVPLVPPELVPTESQSQSQSAYSTRQRTMPPELVFTESQSQSSAADSTQQRKSTVTQSQSSASHSTMTAVPSTKEHSVDPITYSLGVLRKRNKDTDQKSLMTCLETLRKYIENLEKHSHEPKFQRINADNAGFQTRVASVDGAVDVLLACGFRKETGFLVVDSDFWRTKGLKLGQALTKIDLLLDQLKAQLPS